MRAAEETRLAVHSRMQAVKSHEFAVHGGRKDDPKRPGKGIWPDHMTIRIPRFHAREMVDQLLRFLLDSDKEEFAYTTCGKLDFDVPEE